MPIYEYTCVSCGHELEAMQKMSDAPLVDCPGCGKPDLKKKVSAAGFRLKGTGWYATDFKGGDKKDVKQEKEGTGSVTKEETKKPVEKSADTSSKTGTSD